MGTFYHPLAAAYNWTPSQIDELTLGEANGLFGSWKENPPTNLLLSAIVQAFGGGSAQPSVSEKTDVPKHVITDSDLTKLSVVAGANLPIRRKDPGLPKTKPVFDMNDLVEKNNRMIRTRGRAKYEREVNG